jgi:hypothetical protein
MPIDKHVLEQLKTDKTLTELSLYNKSLTDEDMPALIEALSQNYTLTKLNVSSNQIGAIGAQALNENHTLTSLTVSNNEIGDIGAKALGEIPTLTTLDVSGVGLGAIAAKALSQHPTLTWLDVSSNNIGMEGAKALSENQTLTTLGVNDTELGAIGAKALSQNQTLTMLYVSNNRLGDEGAIALSEIPSLTWLDMSWNDIGDEGAKALSQHPSLTWLDVSHNEIEDEGAKALSQNQILATLYVCGRGMGGVISHDVRQQLEQSLAANKQRQVAQRNAFIFRLDQALVALDKLVEAQDVALPRELIAHIGSFLDARFYLQLADIHHPAHIAKTQQQVYGCALFLSLQQPGRVMNNDIVERKSNQGAAYQPFMFKTAACDTREPRATEKCNPILPTCPIL